MESYTYNTTLNNEYNLIICKHIKNLSSNYFIQNFIENDGTINLFNYKMNYNSRNEIKSSIDSYFIKNLSLDWVALNNPQNLSLSAINRDGCLFTIAFNENGSLMASSNHNHQIEIWDFEQKKVKKVIKDHKEIVTCIDYLHGDTNQFMSCSLDKTIKLWKDNECIHTFLDHSDWVRSISLSKDNSKFLSGCVSSIIKLWDMNTFQVIDTISNSNSDPELLNTVNSLSFMNENPNIFLCGLRNGTVKLFDTRMTQNIVQCEFKAHKNKLNSIKFNKHDRYLISSGRDSLTRLWDFRRLPVK
jgi:WD40 repeat protein